MSVGDARGYLFIREAWRECVSRCSGKVVFVKCMDSVDVGYLSGGSGSGGGRGRRCSRKDIELRKLFVENGVVVDLFSDSLGWDSDSDAEDNGDGDGDGDGGCHIDYSEEYSGKVVKGSYTKLQSVLDAIQQAAKHISTQGETEEKQEQQQQQQQPIPIIFDSVTPLLLHHGVEKLTVLLTRLKQSPSEFNADVIMNMNKPINSPIFIPSLSEMLPPRSNRILEDHADAVMTLNGGKLSLAKRSARGGGMICGGFSGGVRLTKDVQLFEISIEGELTLLKKSDGDVKDKKSTKVNEKAKSSVEENQDVKGVTNGMQQMNVRGRKEEKTLPEDRREKTRPVLQHEDTARSASNEDSNKKPAPRIYMEEDDPEFDDLDEEDPDDDLDI